MPRAFSTAAKLAKSIKWTVKSKKDIEKLGYLKTIEGGVSQIDGLEEKVERGEIRLAVLWCLRRHRDHNVLT